MHGSTSPIDLDDINKEELEVVGATGKWKINKLPNIDNTLNWCPRVVKLMESKDQKKYVDIVK